MSPVLPSGGMRCRGVRREEIEVDCVAFEVRVNSGSASRPFPFLPSDRGSTVRHLLCLAAAVALVVPASGADPKPAELAKKAVEAVGGPDKLLRTFRFKEKLNVSSDPKGKANPRESTLDLPGRWWFGTAPRDKADPRVLAWAWSLGVLVDPKSKMSSIPDATENEKPAFGLRVEGTVDPAMDLYFDKADYSLVRIDWKANIHRFSDVREHDGVKYPAKVVGYKKATGKPWYYTEIVEIERLKELPGALAK